MQLSWFVLLAAACGRVGFDPADDGGSGGGPASCTPAPDCTDGTLSVGIGSSGLGARITTDHGLSSQMCASGTDNPDVAFEVVPQRDANLTLTVTPSTAFMHLEEGCCGGRELACGGSMLQIARKAGETFVVVIEGLPGTMVFLQVAAD